MMRFFSTCQWQREIVFQLMYSALTVTALIGPGMSMGYSGVAIPLLSNVTTSEGVDLSQSSSTWFASIVTISMPFGCLASLKTMNYGRRIALFLASITCSIGWILVATSYNIVQMLIGRFITGFASGMVATPGSVYLAEMSSVNLATVLTPSTSLTIAFGSMFVYFLGFVIQAWRLVAIISITIPTISAIAIYYLLPESPRFLLNNGRKDEAKASLLKLRGLKTENPKFIEEFQTMVTYSESKYDVHPMKNLGNLENSGETKMNINEDEGSFNIFQLIMKKIQSCWKTLMIPQVWKPLLIINIFFIAQQFCGLYIIIAYSIDFLTKAGVTQDPNLISVILGLLQMVSIFLLVVCGDKIGRRPIAIISGVGMSISLLVLTLHSQFFKDQYEDWLPITCIIIFELTGTFGFSTLPWAMIGEIFPTKFVSYLGPITTFMCGLYNFASVQLYPTLVEFDVLAMLYVYTFVSIIATIFVILALPETRGKTKAEIEKQF